MILSGCRGRSRDSDVHVGVNSVENPPMCSEIAGNRGAIRLDLLCEEYCIIESGKKVFR